jgi:hypothetical protein
VDTLNKRSLALVARLGYAARGTVYVLIGGLALLAMISGAGGKTTGSKGALSALSDASWGTAVIVLIAVGLVAFSGWRAVQAVLDTDDHGTSFKGLVIRVSLAVSGITHLLLGVYAASLAMNMSSDSGGSGSQDAAALILQQPFGRYVLGCVALIFMGAALAHMWKGASGGFRERLSMPKSLLDRLSPLCGFGLIARGLIFLVIAGFFFYAAFTIDPDQAGGLENAMHWLRDQPYGIAFYAAAAAGLLAFGLYGYIEARWRKVG